MSDQEFRAERAPWRGFPKVVRNGDLGTLSKEPEYRAAKQGDMRAALELADRLVTDDFVSQLHLVIGDKRPRVVPVLATEASGNNKLPLAFAEVISDRMGLPVEMGILQREKVSRTDSGADHRLAFNPTFTGSVVVGQDYLVVDDTLTMGGTLASLRGYIENRGGHVVAASVMTAHQGAVDLEVKPKMLAAIEAKHGTAMNEFWKETFGYGIDQLTQGEAGHLKAAASVDAIRTRIAEARYAGFEQMDARRAEAAAESAQLTASQVGDAAAEALELEQQQGSSIETPPVEQVYEALLKGYVEAKHHQVERIESRLENQIERQQSRIQSTLASKPGLFSLPSTKASWDSRQVAQQARLSTLGSRLEFVREIKEGMGIHSPKIEELAARKLREAQPDLAADFDAEQQNKRRRQVAAREGDLAQEQKQDRRHGRGNSLTQKPSR
nr:phosphoribosyltransferase [Pseudomonas sp. PDM20]MBD9686823.1 phosphoribosyltransferase [Pseudomonas sp. PDM20]